MRWHIALNVRLTFDRLYGVISQKIQLFLVHNLNSVFMKESFIHRSSRGWLVTLCILESVLITNSLPSLGCSINREHNRKSYRLAINPKNCGRTDMPGFYVMQGVSPQKALAAMWFLHENGMCYCTWRESIPITDELSSSASRNKEKASFVGIKIPWENPH